MTRVSPRARLHSSELLRVLASQGLVGASADSGDVGQRLGDWLDFRQAITLQAFIGSVDDPSTPPVMPTARIDADVLHSRFTQVRAALEQSILRGSVPAPGLARIALPPVELEHPIDPKTAFDPFRRHAAGHQRQMDTILRALRLQLRSMLDKGTDKHRQLAALDAILDNVLMAREGQLLGQITTEFEKRFARSLRKHMKQLAQSAQADEPAPRTEPWLAPLRQDLLACLLAELDLRLQPVLGLIEALSQAPAQQQ